MHALLDQGEVHVPAETHPRCRGYHAPVNREGAYVRMPCGGLSAASRPHHPPQQAQLHQWHAGHWQHIGTAAAATAQLKQQQWQQL
jgi:hypothetical protein